MSDSENIRLFLVDDHPIVRAGLHTIEEICPEMQIVGESGSAEEALPSITRLLPDVVLLDIRLPGGNGVELCRAIKAASPASRVLILTSYSDEQLIFSALDAGADGYLLKENDTMHLIDAIQNVHRGEIVYDPKLTRRADNSPTDASGKAVPSLAALTPQERRLLAEVAKGKTDKEAAVELGLSAKTVRNYLDRIFTKLGVHTRTQAAMAFIRARERLWEP